MPVTVIIPAYNEEERIPSVIAALKNIELVKKVIVVNDGSEDKTALVAEECGACVVDMKVNGGKAAAMYAGTEMAETDLIMFLDADLIGLKAQHVLNLVKPIASGGCDMTVGVFISGRVSTDMAQLISPQLSGQRVLKRESFLKLASESRDIGYGIERVITQYAKKNEWVVVMVELDGVTQITKEEKLGFSKGTIARLRMYADIVKTIKSSKKPKCRKKASKNFG